MGIETVIHDTKSRSDELDKQANEIIGEFNSIEDAKKLALIGYEQSLLYKSVMFLLGNLKRLYEETKHKNRIKYKATKTKEGKKMSDYRAKELADKQTEKKYGIYLELDNIAKGIYIGIQGLKDVKIAIHTEGKAINDNLNV